MDGCTGIIAEYNPFHRGHRYHIERTRALSPGRIIVAMSGCFVQRGDVAAFDPYIRASWALNNGADMVILLPTLFALANAQRFANGGVSLLNATGLVGALSFGVETKEPQSLIKLAETLDTEPDFYKTALAHALKQGKSFPAARSMAMLGAVGEQAHAQLLSPNNILAIEYLRAINSINLAIRPIFVERLGAGHDSPLAQDSTASASAIREAIKGGVGESLHRALTDDVWKSICAIGGMRSVEDLSQTILYSLRRMNVHELAQLPDVAEGLENVIYSACRECGSYSEMLAAIKSKRYTLARIRRICLCALLGIAKADHMRDPNPRYLRVIGVRRGSISLLSELANNAHLPVITGKPDYDAMDDEAKRAFDIDLFAGEVAALCDASPGAARSEFLKPLLIV